MNKMRNPFNHKEENEKKLASLIIFTISILLNAQSISYFTKKSNS